MLLRLVLLILLVGAGIAAYLWWRSTRLMLASGREEAALPELQAALQLRARIVEVLDRYRADDGGAIRAQLEEVIAELRAHLELTGRVAGALEQVARSDPSGELAKIEDGLREASDPEARRALETTADRLRAQKEHVERLGKRKEILDATTRRIGVELTNLHLALLDAVAAEGGGSAERLEQARSSLADAAEALRRRASAESEVAKALGRSD